LKNEEIPEKGIIKGRQEGEEGDQRRRKGEAGG
jgi:hypothetical protein